MSAEIPAESSRSWFPLGLRYMALSAFFFSLMSLFVKLAGREMASQQIVLARAAIALVLSWGALKRAKIPIWGNNKKLLFFRGLLGFVGLSCFFYAVTHLPLADSTVIHYTNPLFVAILAAIFLSERIGSRELAGVSISLVGVALITRPSFLFGGESRLDLFPVSIALIGAFAAACAYTAVRALGETDHPLVVVFYFPLIATPLAIPTAWPVLSWPTWSGWLLLLGVGVTTQIAQVLMTKGLHLEAAGRATSITYLQIVFAFIIGVVVFSETPTWGSLLGSALIIGSSIFVAISRRKRAA